LHYFTEFRSFGIDPKAMAGKFYDWLMALHGWLAGLAKQATAGCG